MQYPITHYIYSVLCLSYCHYATNGLECCEVSVVDRQSTPNSVMLFHVKHNVSQHRMGCYNCDSDKGIMWHGILHTGSRYPLACRSYPRLACLPHVLVCRLVHSARYRGRPLNDRPLAATPERAREGHVPTKIPQFLPSRTHSLEIFHFSTPFSVLT